MQSLPQEICTRDITYYHWTNPIRKYIFPIYFVLVWLSIHLSIYLCMYRHIYLYIHYFIEQMPITGRGCFLEARVCRERRKAQVSPIDLSPLCIYSFQISCFVWLMNIKSMLINLSLLVWLFSNINIGWE